MYAIYTNIVTWRYLRPLALMVVFLTTPNYRSLWPLIEWGLDRFTSAAALDGDQHVAHYHPGLLAEVAREAGFFVERTATVSCLAPWIAPVSWNAALRLHRAEVKHRWLVGSVIACVLRKEGASSLKGSQAA